MSKELIEQLKSTATEIKPDQEWLEAEREHVRIRSYTASQTKHAPQACKGSSCWKRVAVYMFGTAFVATACYLLIISPLPGMDKIRQSAHQVFPSLFMAPEHTLNMLESHNPKLEGAMLPAAAPAQVPEDRSQGANAIDKEKTEGTNNNGRFSFSSASSSPQAELTRSTTSTSSPADGKRPTIIETLKKIIHLPESPEKPEVVTETKENNGKKPEDLPEQSELKENNGKKTE